MELEKHINDLIVLQRKLLQSFTQLIDPSHIQSNGDLSIFVKSRTKSKTFSIGGECWKLGFHGVGVCFTREADGVIIDFDKHLDKPDCFSPWRLCLYLESVGIDEDHNRLRILLDKLAIDKLEYDLYELRKTNA